MLQLALLWGILVTGRVQCVRLSSLRPVLEAALQVPLPEDRLDFIEICAGDHALTDSLQAFSYAGKAIDARYSRNHDFMRTIGFMAVLTAVRNLRRPALVWFAPPCSSWVWMSRGTTGRRLARPAGFASRLMKVRRANVFVRRMIYVLYVAWMMGHYIVVEQPGSSLLFDYKPMRRFMFRIKATLVSFSMGTYCSPSRKPTMLWGTLPGMSSLQNHISKLTQQHLRYVKASGLLQITRRYVDDDGQEKVVGGRDLVNTQAYTASFGMAIASLFAAARENSTDMASVDFDAILDDLSDGGSDDDCIDDFLKGRAGWKLSSITSVT